MKTRAPKERIKWKLLPSDSPQYLTKVADSVTDLEVIHTSIVNAGQIPVVDFEWSQAALIKRPDRAQAS